MTKNQLIPMTSKFGYLKNIQYSEVSRLSQHHPFHYTTPQLEYNSSSLEKTENFNDWQKLINVITKDSLLQNKEQNLTQKMLQKNSTLDSTLSQDKSTLKNSILDSTLSKDKSTLDNTLSKDKSILNSTLSQDKSTLDSTLSKDKSTDNTLSQNKSTLSNNVPLLEKPQYSYIQHSITHHKSVNGRSTYFIGYDKNGDAMYFHPWETNQVFRVLTKNISESVEITALNKEKIEELINNEII
jgi:hypothetical protein